MVQSPEIPEVHGIHWRRRRAMRGAEEAGMTPQSGSEHVDGRVAMSVGGDTDEATLGGGAVEKSCPIADVEKAGVNMSPSVGGS